MPDDQVMRCETCRYYDSAGCTVDGGWNAGRCRRAVPTRDVLDGRYGPEGRGVWPLVSFQDWCGEYSSIDGVGRRTPVQPEPPECPF